MRNDKLIIVFVYYLYYSVQIRFTNKQTKLRSSCLNFIRIWGTSVDRATRCVMDATSIITQVSRDDEQLNVYPSDKGGKQ